VQGDEVTKRRCGTRPWVTWAPPPRVVYEAYPLDLATPIDKLRKVVRFDAQEAQRMYDEAMAPELRRVA